MKLYKTLPFITFLLLMTVFTPECLGQKIERFVIPAAGDVLSSNEYTLQFTFGESYAQTIYDGGQLTQGFLQEWAVVTATDQPEVDALVVKVYPNLTPGILNIEVAESVEASVFDVNGHMLKNWHLEGGRISVQIDELPTGMYIIVFKSEEGNRISSVKVNKVL